MRWNLRMRAAERGIWKSTDMRRLLAGAGMDISAGKMSGLWTGTPTTIRLEDLETICLVLDCDPAALLICEKDKAALRRPVTELAPAAGERSPLVPVAPRPGARRSAPPL